MVIFQFFLLNFSAPNTKSPNKNLKLNFERNSSDSEELMVVLGYGGEEDIDSDSLEGSSDSEGELFVNEGLATITEEERVSGSSAQSSRGKSISYVSL